MDEVVCAGVDCIFLPRIGKHAVLNPEEGYWIYVAVTAGIPSNTR